MSCLSPPYHSLEATVSLENLLFFSSVDAQRSLATFLSLPCSTAGTDTCSHAYFMIPEDPNTGPHACAAGTHYPPGQLASPLCIGTTIPFLHLDTQTFVIMSHG